jgi:hypothetical protein
MEPVCVKCSVEMRCKKNGVTAAGSTVPNYQRSGDKYYCPECGFEIVTGFRDAFESNTPADILITEG